MQNNDFPKYANDGLHDEVLNILKNMINETKILDIGCGGGNLLHKISMLGFKNLNGCDGFIENNKLKKFARFKKLNINIDLNKKYIKNNFDLVTMVEVIEHLENPNFVINNIYDILKKDGLLIITTPNIQTLISRLLFLFEGNLFSFRENDIRPKYCAFPNHIAPFFFIYLKLCF